MILTEEDRQILAELNAKYPRATLATASLDELDELYKQAWQEFEAKDCRLTQMAIARVSDAILNHADNQED